MIRPVRFLLLALLALLLTLPAAVSAERVASLPAFAPSSSARFEIANAINGDAFVVGRGEVITPRRMHYMLRTVPFPGEAEESIEVVIYDGRVYFRENDGPRWTAQLLSGDVINPVVELVQGAEEVGPIEQLGSITIDGVVTDQYQILVGDPADPPFVTADLWIGQQRSYLYQSQITEHHSDPDLGSFRLEIVARAYAFDDPTITITPPNPADVDPISGPVPWSVAPRARLTTAQVSPLALMSARTEQAQRQVQR
jgi:hypothetical protein